MSRVWNRIKLEAIQVITIVGIVGVCGFALREACKQPKKAAHTIGVRAENFQESTEAAMDLLNGLVGCAFLVPGEDAVVKSTDGEPCGATFHPENRTGEHPAEAYECPGKEPRWEVHISWPGDLHDQVCIVGHELLHLAGLPDRPGKGGLMGLKECPDHILMSDWEVDRIRRDFCHEGSPSSLPVRVPQ